MPTINETLKQLEAQRNLAQKELAGLEAAINALKPLVAVTANVQAKAVAPVAAPAEAKPAKAKKGKMSAAGKANIRAAVKARWAKVRAEKRLVSLKAYASTPVKSAKPATAPAKPAAAMSAKSAAVSSKKVTISAAGMANIRAAAKARWAKFRAEKAKAKK